MSTLWKSGVKSEDSDISSVESMLEKCHYLSQDDKDFVLASFNAGKFGYVLEYIFNKAMKVLEESVFTIGEEVVIGICHWVDKSVLIKFFDIYVLRLASQLELLSKAERMELVYINEILQHRRDEKGENTVELLKKDVEKYLKVCFNSVLHKDFTNFGESFNELINLVKNEEIIPFSDKYSEIINAPKHEINLFLRLMFVLLYNSKKEEISKDSALITNVKTLFPLLWENIGINDKKFFAYYLKVAGEDSLVYKVVDEISSQIKLQDFAMELPAATKLLKICQEIISSHYSINNHAAEVSALLSLQESHQVSKLFLRSYITPSLITYLGNNFGYLNESHLISKQILENISEEKWLYYFKNFFEKDDFVLITLIITERCLKDWCSLIKEIDIEEDEISNELIRDLLKASRKNDYEKIVENSRKIFFNKDDEE